MTDQTGMMDMGPVPPEAMVGEACPCCGGSGQYGDACVRAINGHAACPSPPQERAMIDAQMPISSAQISMTYRNYRGEIDQRTIVPIRLWFGSTDWHPKPGWLIEAYDVAKAAHRDFALADCQFADLCASGQQVRALDIGSVLDPIIGYYREHAATGQPGWGIDERMAAAVESAKCALLAALTPAPEAAQAEAVQVSPESLTDLIGELGREVYNMLDDCETSGPVGDEVHTITDRALKNVSGILDRIDALPFEVPGVILGPGAMLQEAIKRTFAPPAAPAPGIAEAAVLSAALKWWEDRTPRDEPERELCRAIAALRALEGRADG